MKYCLKFEIVIGERYLRPKVEIKKLIILVDPLQSDKVLIKILELLSEVLILSFRFSIKDNFNYFIEKSKKDYLARFFLIYQFALSEEVKIKCAIFFSYLGLDDECWQIMKVKNILLPIRNTLFNFVKNSLNTSCFNNYIENKTYHVDLINEVVNMLHFFSLDSTNIKIYYKELYVLYFDLAIMIFYSYHESFRFKALYIFQTFTCSLECKIRLFNNQNSPILEQIKSRVKKSFKKMLSLVDLYNDTELHSKHFIKSKSTFDRTQNTRYIQKYEDNLAIYTSTLDSIKNIYFSFLKEFGLLIGIYTNLLVNPELNKYSHLLFDELFFEEIKKIIFYFQENNYFNKELENKKNEYNYLTMYTNQLILIQIIYYPNARIDWVGGKNLFVREDNRQYSTLLYLFNILKNYKDNDNVIHKIIFCVNRYLELNLKFKLYQDILFNIIKEIHGYKRMS